jgi:hypothetical protein
MAARHSASSVNNSYCKRPSRLCQQQPDRPAGEGTSGRTPLPRAALAHTLRCKELDLRPPSSTTRFTIPTRLASLLDFCPSVRQGMARCFHVSLPRPSSMPQAPGRTGSAPVMAARVLRTPGHQPVCKNTTVPITHGVRTSSYRKRSPWLCLSKRLHCKGFRSAGAEDKGVQPRCIARTSKG